MNLAGLRPPISRFAPFWTRSPPEPLGIVFYTSCLQRTSLCSRADRLCCESDYDFELNFRPHPISFFSLHLLSLSFPTHTKTTTHDHRISTSTTIHPCAIPSNNNTTIFRQLPTTLLRSPPLCASSFAPSNAQQRPATHPRLAPPHHITPTALVLSPIPPRPPQNAPSPPCFPPPLSPQPKPPTQPQSLSSNTAHAMPQQRSTARPQRSPHIRSKTKNSLQNLAPTPHTPIPP